MKNPLIGAASPRWPPGTLERFLPGFGLDSERVRSGLADRGDLNDPAHASVRLSLGRGPGRDCRHYLSGRCRRSTRAHSDRKPSAGLSCAAYTAGKMVATRQMPTATTAGKTNSTGRIDTGKLEMK